jgi:hypothetical protein
MLNTDKSDVSIFTPGKFSTITWGAVNKLHFTSESTVAGSVFRNQIGSVVDFGAGPRQTWSTAPVFNTYVNDTVSYNLKSNFMIGRNTAFKQQNYFYVTAGFDSEMAAKTETALAGHKGLAERLKIPNLLLKVLGSSYTLLATYDLTLNTLSKGTEKVGIGKISGGTWTSNVRDLLERGTSGIAYTLSNLQTVLKIYLMQDMIRSTWKDLARSNYHPNAVVQVEKQKGVFLGAQYANPADSKKRNVSGIYLDSTIRLQSSMLQTTGNNSPQDVFYPRDVEDQSTIKWYDQFSPEKLHTQYKNKRDTEPVEYAAFNGFKGQVDSSIELSPSAISSVSSRATQLAQSFSIKAVTSAAITLEKAQAYVRDSKRRLSAAKIQMDELTKLSKDAALQSEFSPEMLAAAPLVAAAKTADLVQRGLLLARAKFIQSQLTFTVAVAKKSLTEARRKAESEVEKANSELVSTSSFFSLSHTGTRGSASVKGSDEGLVCSLANKSSLVLSSDETSLQHSVNTSNAAGLYLKDGNARFGTTRSNIEAKSDALVMSGGGGAIKLANGSATIGDLKITGLGGGTSFSDLKKAQKTIKNLDSKFDRLRVDMMKEIHAKSLEIEKLKDALAEQKSKSNKSKYSMDDF